MLRIEWDGREPGGLDDHEQEALSSSLGHAEDAVNDALPQGFYCTVDGPVGEAVDLAAVRALEQYAGEDGA